MLITFKYKNFKSFKNENILDLEATTLKEHEYNVVKMKNVNLLTMAAIYGANASGKSNVLQAFEYMKNMILINNDSMEYSQIKEENIYSFMMNKYPISLEVEILSKDGKIYKYGFESLNDKIKSEWMYEKKINKFYTIFERGSIKIPSFSKVSLIFFTNSKAFKLSPCTHIDCGIISISFPLIYSLLLTNFKLSPGSPIILLTILVLPYLTTTISNLSKDLSYFFKRSISPFFKVGYIDKPSTRTGVIINVLIKTTKTIIFILLIK